MSPGFYYKTRFRVIGFMLGTWSSTHVGNVVSIYQFSTLVSRNVIRNTGTHLQSRILLQESVSDKLTDEAYFNVPSQMHGENTIMEFPRRIRHGSDDVIKVSVHFSKSKATNHTFPYAYLVWLYMNEQDYQLLEYMCPKLGNSLIRWKQKIAKNHSPCTILTFKLLIYPTAVVILSTVIFLHLQNILVDDSLMKSINLILH